MSIQAQTRTQSDKFQCGKCDLRFGKKDDLIIHEHEDHVNISATVTTGDDETDVQYKETLVSHVAMFLTR